MGTSDLLATAKRRAYVLRLRKAGATYREIAGAALEKFGADQLPETWDCRYAHKDVSRELDKLRTVIGEDADEIRQMELERLNDMLKALYASATRRNPDYGAIDRVLKIMRRRAELLGLDAPQRQEISGPEGGALTFHVVYEDEDTE